jgi:hypothetical protein
MRLDDAVAGVVLHGDYGPMREWLNGSHDEEDLADAARSYRMGNQGFNLLHVLGLRSPVRSHYANDVIQRLIALGVDIHARCFHHGSTPLHYCVEVEDSVALLDAGADVNALSLDGKTPLIMYARAGHYRHDIVRLLVRRGADLSLVDNDGRDAMMSASGKTLDFLTDVVAAGSWKAYLRAPRIELVRLRSLCARGRAPSSDSFLQRLFGTPGSSARSTRAAKLTSRPLPNEVFWHVLTYWCTSRDLL